MIDHTDSIAIITGAGSGIGRALTLAAAKRGIFPIATDVNAEYLEQTAQLLDEHQLDTHLLDVSDAAAIAQFAQDTMPKLAGKSLLLFNNAGISLVGGSFTRTELTDFRRLIDINLWGTITMTKYFLPQMLKANSGSIINISSIMGMLGIARQVAYCTSKFAVRGFTESLRMELFGTNIRTLCVHPGAVQTNIVNDSLIGENHNETHREKLAETFRGFGGLSADEAADAIFDALERGKERLVLGEDAEEMYKLVTAMPVKYTAELVKNMG
ncbi:MAG: SDR family NAD(P)-dependent oxidoreductase [Bacteroidota bacterium]